MISVVNPVYHNPLLRHVQPRMGQQLSPMVAPAGGPSVSQLMAAGGVTILTLGLGAVSALFLYGVASESKSKLVKTTGYIGAGVAALGTVVEALGAGVLIAKA